MTIERIRKILVYFGIAALLLFFIAWSLVKFDALGFNGNQIKYSAQSGEIIPVEFNIKFDETDESLGQLPNHSDFTNTSENIDGGGLKVLR